LAPVIKECERREIPISTIHTGQHYSDELDSVFFEELNLPLPTHNLGVRADRHGSQTGQMTAEIEGRLLEEQPATVLVHGDTNSTLAGGLAASKLEVTLGHIEAGLRSRDREMPEEVNRRLVDHAADWLYAPTDAAADNLAAENLGDRTVVTGNTIVDAVAHYRDIAATESSVLADFDITHGEFILLTLHRPESVDDPATFERLLQGVRDTAIDTGLPAIYPIHPRAKDRLETAGIRVPDEIRIVDPLPFFDFLHLEDTARLVLTDSGGVQEETSILQTHCVTLRESTERPETLEVGANRLVGTDPIEIRKGVAAQLAADTKWTQPFGDGDAASRIVDDVATQLTSE